MIKYLFIFLVICYAQLSYSQSRDIPTDQNTPSFPEYGNHLIDIYSESLDSPTTKTKRKLQDRLYQVVNLYDTWATEKVVGKAYSDLLFYIVIDLHEEGHANYTFYYQHCSAAVMRADMNKEPCDILLLLKG